MLQTNLINLTACA